MIPIHDANPVRRIPWITLAIIAANVALFLLWEPTFAGAGKQQAFFFCHAEIPWEVSHQENLAQGGGPARHAIDQQLGGPPAGAIVQALQERRCPGKSWIASIFESMFLHAGWLHIGGNMLFLYIFGNNIEDRMGRVVYPLFYLLGGLAAAGLQLGFGPDSVIPNLGASGAIAAVLGAYLVLFPRARVTTLLFFLFITVVELPAALVLAGWFILQLFSGVGGLGTQVNSGVAYWAHVGGFAFGALVAWVFYRGSGSSSSTRMSFPT